MRNNGAATISQSPGFPTYGALECKRSYQKHLGLAVMTAGALHLLAMWGFLHFSDIQNRPSPRVPPTVTEEGGIPILPPPPPIILTRPPQVPVETEPRVPISLGVAKAVPDAEVPEESMFASQEDLGRLSDKSVEDILALGSGDSLIITHPPESLPARGEYVYHDEEPIPLSPGTYEYPPLALQAGIEGTVLIEALVDKDGTVKDAWVVKPSGCSAGFEEAALEAAYKIKYKPALSNGQPVAVRVTYPVRFQLK